VNNPRGCFTFIAVRYTVGNLTIGKGGRGLAANSEHEKPWRRFFKSRATRVVGVVVLGVVVVAVLFVLLNWYVAPTKPSERKYLVQSFVIVVAGGTWLLVGAGVAGVLYVSRRNLKQQRELEELRTQENALPAYLDRMVRLLNDKDKPLRRSEGGAEASILAKGLTLSVLPRLDGERKARVLQFLYETDLIIKDRSVVDLLGADLRGADLRGANLSGADLREADLHGANLREADLHWADLTSANLSRAYLGMTDLSLADLSGADLRNVEDLTVGQLDQAYSLEGATMPNGSRHP
jgi:hypothetical protein